jgi:pimeloyl-ACP methyl ester carboxylesterase
MRAIEPTERGQLHLHGFQVGYETFGDPAQPAVLLLPPWQIVHSRVWKMQVPYLARSFHVIAFDTAGNGLGERTTDPAAFEYERIVRQVTGVLDHLAIEHVSVIGFSRGCDYGILMAATEPERVERLMLIGNGVSREGFQPRPAIGFWDRRDTYDGWEKRNGHYVLEHYDDWLAFFFPQINPEPHSTRVIEMQTAWAKDTTPEILVQTVPNADLLPSLPAREAIDCIRCPVLLVHGDDDRCDPIDTSYDLIAARPDWEMVVMEGCGHGVIARHPVQVNLLIHELLTRRLPAGQWTPVCSARA